jgi:hypothetical protein
MVSWVTGQGRATALHLPHLVNGLMVLAALGQEGAVQVDDEAHGDQQQGPHQRAVPRRREGGDASHHGQTGEIWMWRMRDVIVHGPEHGRTREVVHQPHQ